MSSYDPPSQLAHYVSDALKTRNNLLEVSLSAQIPQPWLVAFLNGKIKNPGVSRIEKLYEHISGKKLDI